MCLCLSCFQQLSRGFVWSRSCLASCSGHGSTRHDVHLTLACAPLSVDGTTPHLISTATLNSCFYPLCTNTTNICFPLNSHGSCFLFRIVVLPLRHRACTLANEMMSKRVLQNAASDTQNALHSTRGTHEATSASSCLGRASRRERCEEVQKKRVPHRRQVSVEHRSLVQQRGTMA